MGGAMGGSLDRYSRQMLFPGIGEAGQQALAAATVVLVGCGALGAAIADTLVRAGFGRLRIVDRDVVELSNLQRQMLFDEDDVAQRRPKALAAARRLREINSAVAVEPVVGELRADNCLALLAGADLVLDGTDNFETRYLINEACVWLGIPWVYGGVIGASGMSMTVRPGRSACLRCVFREPPPRGSLPTADVGGVIAPVVRVISSVEVSEGMKLLVGTGRINPGLLSVELWEMQWDLVELASPDPDCPVCGQHRFSLLDPS
ncbi:MAG: thiazole biosynthesis adenylyltransferase ThiF [Chloroflexi bacterium]|nr:thiazole biosynthesis adenylyltransferase ThiF [Chloroflexota bacterium]